jgi:uncharacterized HhH-GPD family protein
VRQDRGVPTLRIAQDDAADELLSRDPLALLIGMLLDQQFPMERAFGAPRLLADRLGVQTLSAAQLAECDPEVLQRHFQGPPALHRYPASMATRTQDVARVLVERYDGRPEALWADAPDGATLLRRIGELPGFGAQKAKIFLALLGKQYGVTPPGWREAAAPGARSPTSLDRRPWSRSGRSSRPRSRPPRRPRPRRRADRPAARDRRRTAPEAPA